MIMGVADKAGVDAFGVNILIKLKNSELRRK
jgi:hypothetical protein